MNAIFKVTALAVLSFATFAQAQYTPGDFPSRLPPGPYSGTGRYRQQKAAREYYEALDSHYRTLEAQNRDVIASIAARRRVEQDREREARTTKIREKNLARRLEREALVSARANQLRQAIDSGKLEIPKALHAGWARQHMDTALALLAQDQPLDGHAQTQLAMVTEEVRQGIVKKTIGSDQQQRADAMQFVLSIQRLAVTESTSSFAQR